jgi:uncharacterized protein YbjQ (UPF0145 family)
MELFFTFGISFCLIIVGLISGSLTERRHLVRLGQRELLVSYMVVTQLRSFPAAVIGNTPPTLLIGEAVIATDYFKSFLASIRKWFGGELRSYQSLLSRARREATLRVLEDARRQGYNAVCNLRYETADVGGNSTDRKVVTVAILASGTAYHAATATG